MNAVAKLFVSLLKQTIKIFLVLVFKENILPGIPPKQDVVYGPRVEKKCFYPPKSYLLTLAQKAGVVGSEKDGAACVGLWPRPAGCVPG